MTPEEKMSQIAQTYTNYTSYLGGLLLRLKNGEIDLTRKNVEDIESLRAAMKRIGKILADNDPPFEHHG